MKLNHLIKGIKAVIFVKANTGKSTLSNLIIMQMNNGVFRAVEFI